MTKNCRGGPGPGRPRRFRASRDMVKAHLGVQRVVLEAIKSAVVSAIVFSIVGASIVGSGWALFCALAVGWLLMPALVGMRSTLDAGLMLMLVALGSVGMVSLAREGLRSLVP